MWHYWKIREGKWTGVGIAEIFIGIHDRSVFSGYNAHVQGGSP
jgi:hypothetical protein